MNFNICRPGFLTLSQLACCVLQLPNPNNHNQGDKYLCQLPKRLDIDIDEDLLAPQEIISYTFELAVLQDKNDGEGWSKVWQFEGIIIVIDGNCVAPVKIEPLEPVPMNKIREVRVKYFGQ